MKDWPEMPPGIAKLPTQDGTGYPIPWFVRYDETGKPDFRIMHSGNYAEAIKAAHQRRETGPLPCWICGGRMVGLTLGPALKATFPIGPMCVINRVSSEPPAHHTCAEWSARVCPFLTTPGRVRREAGLPEDRHTAGVMVERNPGVTALWPSTTWRLVKVHNGYLFDVGEPFGKPQWLCEGRDATRDEVLHSIESGIPTLAAAASAQGPAAEAQFASMLRAAMPYVPKARA